MKDNDMEILARAIGSRLRHVNGLSAAFVPAGVSKKAAHAIVDSANAGSKGAHSFAILISSAPEDNERFGAMSPQTAAKYRHGKRLAVVVSDEDPPATFTQVFSDVMGSDFPSKLTAESSPLGFSNLASAIIDELMNLSTLDSSLAWDRSAAESALTQCLLICREAYESTTDSSRTWNALWFQHVTQGLANLATAITDSAAASTPMTVDELFASRTFASFALPRPRDTSKPGISGKKVADAIEAWWSNEEALNLTCLYLDQHPETKARGLDRHPVSNIQWDGFDQEATGNESSFLALCNMAGKDSSTFLNAFSSLSESQFQNPIGDQPGATKFAVSGPDGESFSIGPTADDGPFLVLLSDQIDSSTPQHSEEFRVVVPTVGVVREDALRSSLLSIGAGHSAVTVEGEFELEDGDLRYYGNFIVQPRYFKTARRSFNLTVSTGSGDSLAAHIDRKMTCQILLAPIQSAGLVLTPIKKSGRFGRPTYRCPADSFLAADKEAPSGPFPIDIKTIDDRLQVTMWGTDSMTNVSLTNATAQPVTDRHGLFEAAFQPSGDDQIVIEQTSFPISAETTRNVSLSPPVAAISRDLPSNTDDLPISVRESIQGAYESLLIENLNDVGWAQALWHVACSEDIEHRLTPMEPAGAHAPLVSASIASSWRKSTDYAVAPEVATSDEAARFVRSFQALDINGHLTRLNSSDESTTFWPSRTSWRHLWEDARPALAEYLDAYRALVTRARETGNPSTIFWASYPLSVSSWRTASNGRCVAVLLSPLHPIRLAWLAGIESALWNAEESAMLAGTIEGWNFPLLGPRGTGQGRMLAVPIDNGDEQVFLGWSMLVSASGDDHEQLRPARRFGAHDSPGASGSGLNGPAVAAALRAYRRMHPHVTTMNIDLACAVESPRLDEVDQSVLSAVRIWTDGKDATPPVGGIRVRDSLNRTGDLPRGALRRLLSGGVNVPVSWSRYDPAANTASESNLKVLQDAGVTVQLTSTGHAANGVAGAWPLRRFEALGPDRTHNNDALSSPALSIQGGWRPFVDALGELEWSEKKPRISSKLHHSSIADGHADWTVSGEGMMNPNAMASLLSTTAGGSQMLWEWRPPYLEQTDNVPLLERRPFISVARVPQSFREKLGSLLSKAVDGDPNETVEQLLGRLGSRGVGLSSLLSMGGTHASGALGFDRAFSLLDGHDDLLDGELLVLPIDACDAFLRALSGAQTHGSDQRRADLLALRLNHNELTFVPIEIKCYGLQSAAPGGVLPTLNSPQLDEAIDQLGSTVVLLEELGREWKRRDEGGTAASIALWSNALATLVETAIRLSPKPRMDAGELAHCLGKILSGSMPLRVGRPLITYFKHEARTSSGLDWETFRGRENRAVDFEYGALACNLGAAFRADHDPESELSGEWGRLLAWSFAAPIPGGTDSDGGEPKLPTDDRQVVSPPSVSTPVDEPVDITEPTHRRETECPAVRENVPHPPVHRVPDIVYEPRSVDIELDGVRFPVGRALDSFAHEMLDFWPGNTGLTQMNIGVVGDLGTGKTQLLKAVVCNLLQKSRETQSNPLSLLVFDYKRDFQEPSFVDATNAHILEPTAIPLNYFELTGEYSKQAAFKRAKSFYDVLSKIYSGVGPVQKHKLVTTITDLYEQRGGKAPLMADVAEAYSEQVNQPDSVSSILQDFAMGEVFSADESEVVDFKTLLDGKVLVVSLDQLGADQQLKNALVILFLNLYYEYMLDAKKWPFQGDDPQLRRLNSFLLVDEATNIMQYEFDVLMTLILQGREFGFGTILASQYLSHFNVGGSNYGEPLLTWFIHRIPLATPQDFKKVGLQDLSKSTADRVPALGLHEAVYRSLGINGRVIRGTPFFEMIE